MEKKSKNQFSIMKRIKSFKYAFKGIGYFIRFTHNAWIHIVAALLVIAAGYFFNLRNGEWALVSIAIGIVFITEAINTAIEYLVDLVSPEFNEKAGRVKDIAAGAVLLAAILAVVIGLIIFIPHLRQLPYILDHLQ